MSQPEPAPSPRRKRISDEQMLDAACAHFGAHGYRAANVADIAADAGTTKMTIYARFGSKEGLLQAAMEREIQILRGRLLSAYSLGPEVDFEERLRQYVRAYFAYGNERPDGFRLLFVHDVENTAVLGRAAMADIAARITAMVAREGGADEPNDVHAIIAALIIGATHQGAGAIAALGVSIDLAAAVTEAFLRNALGPLRDQGRRAT